MDMVQPRQHYYVQRHHHLVILSTTQIVVTMTVAFSPAQLSFLEESRRLSDERMRRELRVKLRYPTVRECLLAERERRASNTGSGPKS